MNRRLFGRRAGGPGVFAVTLQRPPGEDVPLCQYIALAVSRQFQAGKIFRCGPQTWGDKNHPLRVDAMNGFDGFFVDTIKRSEVMVELFGRLINQIKTQQRRTLAEIAGYRYPPVHYRFLIFRLGVAFPGIRLISDNRDHAVLLARLHQLTQMNQPRLGGCPCNADTHMA